MISGLTEYLVVSVSSGFHNYICLTWHIVPVEGSVDSRGAFLARARLLVVRTWVVFVFYMLGTLIDSAGTGKRVSQMVCLSTEVGPGLGGCLWVSAGL